MVGMALVLPLSIVPVTNVDASARVSGVTKGTKHRHRRSGSSQLVSRRLSIRLGISWYGGTSSVADAVAEDPEPLDSRRGGRAVGIDAAGAMGIDAPPELRKDRGKAGGRFPALVHVAIVLVGLVAGKLRAVAFTCSASCSYVRSARRSPPGGRGLARLFPDQA